MSRDDSHEYHAADAAPLPYDPGQPEFDVGTRIDLNGFPEKFRMPRIAPGSHIESARAIIALELDVEEAYNTLFLNDPEAMARRFYVPRDDRHMFDVVTPSAYEGMDLNTYWDWVSPQFDGLIEQTDIYVTADRNVGFVRMHQVYEARNIYTEDKVRWVMRQTDGIVRIGDEWKIAHTHFSWPANVDTLAAGAMSLNLPRPWTKESYRYREDRKVVDGRVTID